VLGPEPAIALSREAALDGEHRVPVTNLIRGRA
jgi:hypothetical protein